MVKNIKLSPIALTADLTNNFRDNLANSSHMLNEAIEIVMKDGSYVKLKSWGASTNPFRSHINITFDNPIDVNQIDKVFIDDLSIKVN